MFPKYKYPEPIALPERQWPGRTLAQPPVWCSVDLRDGNQALPVPMSPETKLAYFNMLLKIGFKEIEVGFPSASQDDFDFVRQLVEKKLAPPGVRISVLTQARKHLIERTVASLQGVEDAIVHLYVATSDLHGNFVFGKNRAGVKKMAVDGTKMVLAALEKAGLRGRVGFEFSPEEFTDSDIDFVIGLCCAVKEAWGAGPKRDFILNLPATVERRPPYQYADMIEYFCRHYPHIKDTTISIHAHNDQGCAVAASEMALLAGAERAEGTLFGHGERTGNLDLMVLAMNLYSRGINIGLDFSDLPAIVKLVEEASGIDVHPRHPYAGDLVFTAFSGSHQDAIRKGIEVKDEVSKTFGQQWKVPYLHVDPADVGRKYEKLIRINSQSGKGGAAFLLEHEFGIYPPKGMLPEIGETVQQLADEKGDEISSQELLATFKKVFMDPPGPFSLVKFSRSCVDEANPDIVRASLTIKHKDKLIELDGEGNGPISAAVHALKDLEGVIDFVVEDFSEKSLGKNADAVALAFAGIRRLSDEKIFYGAGEHANIDLAGLRAIFAALNRAS
ncbi:MAG: 2-isopropylmalate synthase [Lentisphaerae bacterium GWF2_52_8]|nr:MAG: 2-isopropylmalate synthase [Lentisphaerae bacterium GWF2_52_8]